MPPCRGSRAAFGRLRMSRAAAQPFPILLIFTTDRRPEPTEEQDQDQGQTRISAEAVRQACRSSERRPPRDGKGRRPGGDASALTGSSSAPGSAHHLHAAAHRGAVRPDAGDLRSYAGCCRRRDHPVGKRRGYEWAAQFVTTYRSTEAPVNRSVWLMSYDVPRFEVMPCASC